jgi:2-methylisocitrate lyase-like PEP mutase family enzyme
MKPTTRFRQQLAQPGLIVAPGAYDGLSAKLIEQAGFDVVYATGGGISRSCGYPDIGLLTMTEVLGYKLAIFASDVQRAAIYGMREVLNVLQREGTPAGFTQTIDFPERDAIIGIAEIQRLEERFLQL